MCGSDSRISGAKLVRIPPTPCQSKEAFRIRALDVFVVTVFSFEEINMAARLQLSLFRSSSTKSWNYVKAFSTTGLKNTTSNVPTHTGQVTNIFFYLLNYLNRICYESTLTQQFNHGLTSNNEGNLFEVLVLSIEK